MLDALRRICETRTLSLPKATNPRELVEKSFDSIVGETEHAWLVPCFHRLFPPATNAQIQQAEESLGLPLSAGYKGFLRSTNGAKLFCVKFASSAALYERFPVFGCSELVEMNTCILETFRTTYADDPGFGLCQRLNYIAFCNAEDGDFQAEIVEGDNRGCVFLLFHGFFYRPFDLIDTELSPVIADSFESWLAQIADSGGWGGRGPWKSRQ